MAGKDFGGEFPRQDIDGDSSRCGAASINSAGRSVEAITQQDGRVDSAHTLTPVTAGITLADRNADYKSLMKGRRNWTFVEEDRRHALFHQCVPLRHAGNQPHEWRSHRPDAQLRSRRLFDDGLIWPPFSSSSRRATPSTMSPSTPLNSANRPTRTSTSPASACLSIGRSDRVATWCGSSIRRSSTPYLTRLAKSPGAEIWPLSPLSILPVLSRRSSIFFIEAPKTQPTGSSSGSDGTQPASPA